MGSKAGRAELDEEWESVRRGWYVGDREFGEALVVKVDKALKGRKRESHAGPARAAHGEAAAQRWLERAPEKVALAWWLREKTTVRLAWVSERLEMGHYTRVTKAISRMKRGGERKLEQLRRKLRRLE